MTTRRRALATTAFLTLACSVAHGRPIVSVQALLGVSGQAEGGGRASFSEELADDLGVMATVEWPIGWQLRLGGRLGYQQATGVDSEESYVGIDADLWARFVFIPGQLEVFAAGALGVSTLTVNDSIAGRGLHAMVGAGAGYPLSPTLRALAGVYYDHRAGDPQREVSDATNELKDVKLSRVLLTAGLAF